MWICGLGVPGYVECGYLDRWRVGTWICGVWIYGLWVPGYAECGHLDMWIVGTWIYGLWVPGYGVILKCVNIYMIVMKPEMNNDLDYLLVYIYSCIYV